MTAKEELEKMGISVQRNRAEKLGIEDLDQKLGLDVSLLIVIIIRLFYCKIQMYTNCKCSFIQEDDKPTDWREICEDFDIQVVTDTESDICDNYTGNDGEEMKKEKNKKKCNRISSDSDTDEETQPMKKNKIISDSSDSEVKEGEKSAIDAVSEAKEGEKKSEIVAAQLRKPTYLTDGRFKCPNCDYVGKSTGKVYSHMADSHGMAYFTCEYCTFTTKNKTSFYNHNTKYCRGRKQERTDENKPQICKPLFQMEISNVPIATTWAKVREKFIPIWRMHMEWQISLAIIANLQLKTKRHFTTIIQDIAGN